MMPVEYDLDIREYWRILRKRKNIIFFAAAIMGLCTFVFAYTNKPDPVYQTSSTVKIEKSSTTTGIYLEALSWSGADFLETQASIITSYPIMELVAKEMGLINKNLDSTHIRSDSQLISLILELTEKVSAEREGNSNLINITAEANQGKEAQKIANTIARMYTKVHTEEVNKRTFESRKFIEDQIARVTKKLTLAENRAQAFREQQNILSLGSQTEMLLEKAAATEAKYLETNKSVEVITLMLKRLDQAIKGGPISEKESFYVPEAPPLYNNLNNKMVALLLKKDTLLLRFTTEHPQVKEIDSQVREITQNMTANLTEKVVTVRRHAESLKKDLTSYQRSLDSLPGKRLQLARLERDIKLNEKVYSLLEEKLHEAKIMEAAKIEEVIIVKPALEPSHPLQQSMVLAKTFIGLFMGFFLGVIAAFLYEMFDTSINTVRDVEEYIGVSVLGVIPAIDLKMVRQIAKQIHQDGSVVTETIIRRLQHLSAHFMPNSTAAECYRSLRTNIDFAGVDKKQQTIAFTSSLSDEGKTMAIINTAICVAQSHRRVLLIDADLRQPKIAQWFEIDGDLGLSEIIMGSCDWREAVKNVTDMMLGEMSMDEVLYTPGLDNLHIITSGRIPPNPAELLNSKSINKFFEKLKDHYDAILIALPPILSAADTSITCAKVDSVVLVYKAGLTPRAALRRAKTQLEHARANIIGIVLNGSESGSRMEIASEEYQKYTGHHENVQKEKSSKSAADRGSKAISWWRVSVVLVAAALLAAGLMMRP